MPRIKVFASKKDLHLALVLPYWDCFKQNSRFEVPWNAQVVWMRLPIYDSKLGYIWFTLTARVKPSRVPAYFGEGLLLDYPLCMGHGL